MVEWPHGYGKCHCGCGRDTNIARQSRCGTLVGNPLRYIRGHRRSANGRITDKDGYTCIRDSTHGRARSDGYVAEHIAVAERVLGKALPKGAVVHHVNEVRADNRPANLVICQDQGYHAHLHRRTRAFDACGHANWLLCPHCGQYDAPENLYITPKPGRTWGRHRACHAAAEYNRKKMSA